jgi:glycosyltransferase involved in cell wall biosynthesis
MDDVSISVAVVTRNRPESLQRTLRSLRSQDAQPFEVLVSDDSEPALARATREVAVAHGCRYLSGPQRGLYANRNAAALACRGTHVRTMDDDHEFPAGHMSACLRAVRARREVVWIIGECLPGDEAGEQPWVCPPQLHPRGFSVTPPNGSRTWAISDGAAIYPREIFTRGLRFFEGFPFGASYLEWGSRLHWLGYEIRHLHGTYVIHHFDPDTRSIKDVRGESAAALFAGLCHSFIYQPTLRNRLLTITQFAVTGVRFGTPGVHAGIDALRAFRQQRRAVLQMQAAAAHAR